MRCEEAEAKLTEADVQCQEERAKEAEKKQQQTQESLESAGQVTEAQDSILKVYASRHTSEKAVLESQVSLLSAQNMALMCEKSEYLQRYVAATAEAKAAQDKVELMQAQNDQQRRDFLMLEGDKRMLEAEKRKTAELAGSLQDRATQLELEYWKKEGEVLSEQQKRREIEARAAEVMSRHARGLTATMGPPMGRMHMTSEARGSVRLSCEGLSLKDATRSHPRPALQHSAAAFVSAERARGVYSSASSLCKRLLEARQALQMHPVTLHGSL